MLGNILAVGLMSMGMGLSGVKDEPKMYAQDEATYTITYTGQDWEEKIEEITAYLSESHPYSNPLIMTSSINLKITSTSTDETLTNATMMYTTSGKINFKNNDSGNFIASYTIESHSWTKELDIPATLNEISITSQDYYEALAEVEPSMGNDIVGTIASGLGIIGALATTFLTGFGNLFYSSGALTPFAIFALVMLGIAVSFAVVKLVLNLIRSNTGA